MKECVCGSESPLQEIKFLQVTLVLRSSLLAEKKLDLLLKLCLQLVHLSRIVLPYRVEPVNVVEYLHLLQDFKKVGQSKSKAIVTKCGIAVHAPLAQLFFPCERKWERKWKMCLVSKYESVSLKYATLSWLADTYLSVNSRLR